MVKLFFWRKSKDREEKGRSRSVSPSKKKDSRMTRFFSGILGKKKKSNNTMESEVSLTTDSAAVRGDISAPEVIFSGGMLVLFSSSYFCVCGMYKSVYLYSVFNTSVVLLPIECLRG